MTEKSDMQNLDAAKAHFRTAGSRGLMLVNDDRLRWIVPLCCVPDIETPEEQEIKEYLNQKQYYWWLIAQYIAYYERMAMGINFQNPSDWIRKTTPEVLIETIRLQAQWYHSTFKVIAWG